VDPPGQAISAMHRLHFPFGIAHGPFYILFSF
jgi:hypothetical protein